MELILDFNMIIYFARLILNKVKDITELVSLEEETLAAILGNSQNAKLLYDFIHKE